MPQITQSRIALYEAMISLAWVDHQLSEEEIEGLVELIDGNDLLTDDQKMTLKSEIDKKSSLKSIWPRLTEAQDRAHLLNMANHIFSEDGEVSGDENTTYQKFLAKHLSSINADQVISDMGAYAAEMRHQDVKTEAQIKDYASQFGLINQLKRLFGL